MIRVELSQDVFRDFDRILDHYSRHESPRGPERIEEILQAIDILAKNPLIGRVVRAGRRELVIGRGMRGYVALYRFVADVDTVYVLAIRSQREAGFRH